MRELQINIKRYSYYFYDIYHKPILIDESILMLEVVSPLFIICIRQTHCQTHLYIEKHSLEGKIVRIMTTKYCIFSFVFV